MSRLIDADVTVKKMANYVTDLIFCDKWFPRESLDLAKVLIKMVQREKTVAETDTVHGKWVGEEYHKKCSQCGTQSFFDYALRTDATTPFCPFCGAKMDEVADR